MKPRVLVIRAAGINCEAETAYAFELVGAETDIVHVNALRKTKKPFKDYQVIAIPGGFSYGDDVASGRILANELMSILRDNLIEFVDRGGLVIGICNGFQVLVKSGLLPGLDKDKTQSVTLSHNVSHLYTDCWVDLECNPNNCVWIPNDENIYLPVAHAEGRFRADKSIIETLDKNNQIALRYTEDSNFNGSDDRIAGICDSTGRVFGLMPHPERFLRHENHPSWTRLKKQPEGAGVKIFRSAINTL